MQIGDYIKDVTVTESRDGNPVMYYGKYRGDVTIGRETFLYVGDNLINTRHIITITGVTPSCKCSTTCKVTNEFGRMDIHAN